MTKLIENTGAVLLYHIEPVYDRIQADFKTLEEMVCAMKNEWGALNEKSFAAMMKDEAKTDADVSFRQQSARRQAGRRLSFLKMRLSVELAIEKILRDVEDSLLPSAMRVKEILEEGRKMDRREIQLWKMNALLSMKLVYSVRAYCKDASLFIERSASLNPELRETLDEEFDRVYQESNPDDMMWVYLCR
ncbi:MAG: hypothetical protein H6677_03720 [Candidatus Obscuribacterales bacterium]|nr:hypothetical protein [Cyanobacteria bacterium HKST-UBA01]MCB9467361.1 hypothetical protein [Candidatus Obscuribacterales bacterium]